MCSTATEISNIRSLATSFADQNPNTVIIEGSNEPLLALTFGSSWTLIYNSLSAIESLLRQSVIQETMFISLN